MTTPARCLGERVGVVLIVGGKWHDVDFARHELGGALLEHDAVQCAVRSDFSDVEAIGSADAVVAYTCDVRPTPEQSAVLAEMLRGGGRLLGLHATNSAIDAPAPGEPRLFRTPDAMPEFTALLGNRFLAHPKIGPFLIEPVAAGHPLVAGVEAFETVDEIYVSERSADLTVLLDVAYTGPCPGFEIDHGSGRHPVLFTRPEGLGSVTYLTLGHCRGRFDVRDQGIADLGVLDRIAWESAEFREILRRCVSWAVHGDQWQQCRAGEVE